MVDTFADNPVLLLFVVIAVGFVLGQIKVVGFSFGIAAVLFAGIAAGAIDPRLKLPDPIWVLGLALFVYTVGLASGPGFFAAIKRRGRRARISSCSAASAPRSRPRSGVGVGLFALGGALATGIFSGALTNTPALAAAIETLKDVDHRRRRSTACRPSRSPATRSRTRWAS